MPEPITVGGRSSLEHTFSIDDVTRFARISGDDNPIHLDAAVAIEAGFGRQVVHGMLVASLISRLLGTRLPGPGTILLAQQLTYLRAVLVGDTVRATVEVLSVRADKPVVVLRTWVETDEVALEGEATVIVRPLTGVRRRAGLTTS